MVAPITPVQKAPVPEVADAQLPPAAPEAEAAGARMEAAIGAAAGAAAAAPLPVAQPAVAAAAQPAAPKPPLDRILADYQVPIDPRPKEMWQGKEVTAGEHDILDNMANSNPWNLPQMRDALADAENTTYNLSGKPIGEMVHEERNDGHQDAFRHAYWNALMTANVGETTAAEFATAHETVGGNPATREAMDLYNNEVGRRIGAQHRDASDEDLASLVRDAVNRGEMLVIDRSGELAWSNTVPIGGHGQASGPECR